MPSSPLAITSRIMLPAWLAMAIDDEMRRNNTGDVDAAIFCLQTCNSYSDQQ